MQSNNTSNDPSALHRNVIVIALIAAAAIGGTVWIVKLVSGPKPTATKAQEFSMVQVAMPPPPPPPPPRDEPPKPETIVNDSEPTIAPDPVAANEPAPADAPAEAAADSGMGSNIQGDGSDGFGLVGRGSGGIIGGRGTIGGTAGSSGSSRWSPYAMQVQRTMEDALRKHEKTRSASLRVTLRVWPDSNGTIQRVQLADSTGDAELDNALQSEVFNALALQSPPPADMPRPIVMRITAQRPR